MVKIKTYMMILFIACACKQPKLSNRVNDYYKDGSIKSQTSTKNGVKDGVQINFYYSGGIKSILNFKKGILDGEQVFYYDNGFVEQKVTLKNGAKEGFWYYYYSSGAMKSSRFCSNDKEILIGADYWDDTLNTIKAILHFNDSGKIYLKKNFDLNGNFVNQEGQNK